MFEKVQDASFINGEHEMLKFWDDKNVFQKLRDKNTGKPKWSFLDGPITANNPMGVHHAWGRTYSCVIRTASTVRDCGSRSKSRRN